MVGCMDVLVSRSGLFTKLLHGLLVDEIKDVWLTMEDEVQEHYCKYYSHGLNCLIVCSINSLENLSNSFE
jgi:hypothetical protein